MEMQKTKIFLLGLFSLFGVILPTQYAVAEGADKTVSRDEMAVIATRGTYLFSTGNIDNPDMVFAPNFVRHEQQYLTPESKLEDMGKLIEHQRSVYKVEDIQTEPLDTIVDVKTNRVAVRWSADVKREPTADAEVPEKMKFEGVTISRFENGRIAEQWVYYDSNLVLTLTRLRYKDYFESTRTDAK
jgi:hypothetical protein